MQAPRPDLLSFSYILFACSGARLVDLARDMFKDGMASHGIAWHGMLAGAILTIMMDYAASFGFPYILC